MPFEVLRLNEYNSRITKEQNQSGKYDCRIFTINLLIINIDVRNEFLNNNCLMLNLKVQVQ